MRMFGFGAGLLVSIALLLVVWGIGKVMGFEVSLLGSLGLTVLLTVVVNIVLAALSKRNRRL